MTCDMKALRSNELAKQSGVNLQTLRYYERQGLLPPPPRTDSGYRAFTPEMVGLIRFIKRAQGLGFTLREIKQLIALREHPDTACAEVRIQTEAKIADVSEKIKSLRAIKRELTRLARACAGADRPHSCAVLTRLDGANGKVAVKGVKR